MPHIQPSRRAPIRRGLDIALGGIENVGDLTYALYYLVTKWSERAPTSYKRLNEARGTLESASAEFYRRKVAPHEDRAIERNGEAC